MPGAGPDSFLQRYFFAVLGEIYSCFSTLLGGRFSHSSVFSQCITVSTMVSFLITIPLLTRFHNFDGVGTDTEDKSFLFLQFSRESNLNSPLLIPAKQLLTHESGNLCENTVCRCETVHFTNCSITEYMRCFMEFENELALCLDAIKIPFDNSNIIDHWLTY